METTYIEKSDVLASATLDERGRPAGSGRGSIIAPCVVVANYDLRGADPKSAKINLINADMRYANLTGADLSGANLENADLSGANLDTADLAKADLFRAHLSGADLSEASLSEANLSHTNMVEANLNSANLAGACLCGAYFNGTDLSQADLSGCLYLESAELPPGYGKLTVTNLIRHWVRSLFKRA